MGIVSRDAVKNTVNREETVYTKPDKRWKRVMRVTSGPKRQKFNLKDV